MKDFYNFLLNVNNFCEFSSFSQKFWLNEKAGIFLIRVQRMMIFYLENYILDIAKDVDMDLEFFELSIKNN